MKIALLGYGKMGKEIEKIALDRKHQVVLTIDINNRSDFTRENLQMADVAIDFSTPESAYENIMRCFEADVPIVCGTTGWLDKFEEVIQFCTVNNKSFFYASNYSIGMNIFFRVNKYLAGMMNRFPNYEVDIEEIHHVHKLDAPSGTAISLAAGIIENLDRKHNWELDKQSKADSIKIKALREGEIPGIHTITYDSTVDFIEIKHSAKNRIGLALGAVLAAEFIQGRRGYYNMDNLMSEA
jgi:4-hydroxy-tetrahydrodipicolinate reductase